MHTPGRLLTQTIKRRASGAGLLALLAAAVGVLLGPTAMPSAFAADNQLCTEGGVNVVVDFQDLGGGVKTACDETGAGKSASQVFADAGFELTPVGAFPGVACQVDGKPADIKCAKMPAGNAYWGLFLAEDGEWGYAPTGADELQLEDGDFVAFSWQSSTTPAPPAVVPVTGDAAAGDIASEAPAQSSDSEQASETDEDSSALAWWIPAVLLVLLAAAGALVVRARRVDRTP